MEQHSLMIGIGYIMHQFRSITDIRSSETFSKFN